MPPRQSQSPGSKSNTGAFPTGLSAALSGTPAAGQITPGRHFCFVAGGQACFPWERGTKGLARKEGVSFRV